MKQKLRPRSFTVFDETCETFFDGEGDDTSPCWSPSAGIGILPYSSIFPQISVVNVIVLLE